MGYRGKVAEQERARELRAQGWTMNEIVAELSVARSSVSIWVRDVEFDESVRAARAGANRNAVHNVVDRTNSPELSKPRSTAWPPKARSASAG